MASCISTRILKVLRRVSICMHSMPPGVEAQLAHPSGSYLTEGLLLHQRSPMAWCILVLYRIVLQFCTPLMRIQAQLFGHGRVLLQGVALSPRQQSPMGWYTVLLLTALCMHSMPPGVEAQPVRLFGHT